MAARTLEGKAKEARESRWCPCYGPDWYLIGNVKRNLDLDTRASQKLARLVPVAFCWSDNDLVAICRRDKQLRCSPFSRKFRQYMQPASIFLVLRTFKNAEPKWIRVRRQDLAKRLVRHIKQEIAS